MDLIVAICMWVQEFMKAIKDEICRFAEWWNV